MNKRKPYEPCRDCSLGCKATGLGDLVHCRSRIGPSRPARPKANADHSGARLTNCLKHEVNVTGCSRQHSLFDPQICALCLAESKAKGKMATPENTMAKTSYDPIKTQYDMLKTVPILKGGRR